MRVELDLALGTLTASEQSRLKQDLPANFRMDDRTHQGYGIMITANYPLPDDVSMAIDGFLNSLSRLHALIKRKGGLLRVGIFHQTYTCTVTIESTRQLADINLSLEISTYPTHPDESTAKVHRRGRG
jgi:hypothetical protein